MIAAIICSPESSFYLSRYSDAGDCFVMLHSESLEGDTLQLYSLGVAEDGHVLVNQNASTGIIDMNLQLNVQNPEEYNLEGSKIMKSEACSLVLEPYSDGTRDLTIFRQGKSGLPAVQFDLCESYDIDTYYDGDFDEMQKGSKTNFTDVGAYKAAFEARKTNPFVISDMSRSGEQRCMVLILVAWSLFKLASFIVDIITSNMDKEEMEKYKLQLNVGKWVLFTGLPAQLLSPWTSLHVHEDCPQIAVWLLPTRSDLFFMNIIIAAIMLFLLFVGLPLLAFSGYRNYAVNILGGCTGLIGFEIVMLWIIEFFWDFPRMPSFPIYWGLIFDFSWPEYSLAWTTSWFRLFAFLIFTWETGFQGCFKGAAYFMNAPIDKE